MTATSMVHVEWQGRTETLTMADAHKLRAAIAQAIYPQRERTMQILDAVAGEFGLTTTDLMRRDRKQPAAFARQVAMFMLREMTALTIREIRQLFHKTDDGTVTYALRCVAEQDEAFRKRLERIREGLRETA